jgi:DNA polymerase II small subunit/DNA polymerase delta subunit B
MLRKLDPLEAKARLKGEMPSDEEITAFIAQIAVRLGNQADRKAKKVTKSEKLFKSLKRAFEKRVDYFNPKPDEKMAKLIEDQWYESLKQAIFAAHRKNFMKAMKSGNNKLANKIMQAMEAHQLSDSKKESDRRYFLGMLEDFEMVREAHKEELKTMPKRVRNYKPTLTPSESKPQSDK